MMSARPLHQAISELMGAGVTDAQLDVLTGFGLRRLDGCSADDTILHKYAAGALSMHGVMAVLYGSDSPEHHAGRAGHVHHGKTYGRVDLGNGPECAFVFCENPLGPVTP